MWMHKQIGELVKASLRTLAFFSLIFALPAMSTELQKKTSSAFDHYVQITEARIAGEMGDANSFLWVDRQPEARRKEFLSVLSKGQVVVQHMETREGGKEIAIPDGMVHHWMATVFVPGVNLQQTLAMM